VKKVIQVECDSLEWLYVPNVTLEHFPMIDLKVDEILVGNRQDFDIKGMSAAACSMGFSLCVCS